VVSHGWNRGAMEPVVNGEVPHSIITKEWDLSAQGRVPVKDPTTFALSGAQIMCGLPWVTVAAATYTRG